MKNTHLQCRPFWIAKCCPPGQNPGWVLIDLKSAYLYTNFHAFIIILNNYALFWPLTYIHIYYTAELDLYAFITNQIEHPYLKMTSEKFCGKFLSYRFPRRLKPLIVPIVQFLDMIDSFYFLHVEDYIIYKKNHLNQLHRKNNI